MNKNEKKPDELKQQATDYVTLAVKGVLGIIPFAGSLLAEIAGSTIPNQRVDRLVKFAKALDDELSKLQKDFVWSQISNENFTDLVEEGLRQAANSLSDERRKYIASMIANGLSSKDVEFVETKHLLKILGEINDVEILWIRYFSFRTTAERIEFQEKHKSALEKIYAINYAVLGIRDKEALQQSYQQHLARLGLLATIYEMDRDFLVPRADKVQGYEITHLGKLLLRFMGFSIEG